MPRRRQKSAASEWLLLVYKIPREPTAGRVFVWRKLKQLGALPVQGAIWVLPHSPRNQEHFQWLATEIIECKGTATIFRARPVFETESAELRDRFEAPVRRSYQRILQALGRRQRDLPELSKQFQATQARDFFRCALSRHVRRKLVAAQGTKK